jgi:hypothetical protein
MMKPVGYFFGRVSEAVCDYMMKPVGYFLVDSPKLSDLMTRLAAVFFLRKQIIFTLTFTSQRSYATLLLLKFTNKLSSNNPKPNVCSKQSQSVQSKPIFKYFS